MRGEVIVIVDNHCVPDHVCSATIWNNNTICLYRANVRLQLRPFSNIGRQLSQSSILAHSSDKPAEIPRIITITRQSSQGRNLDPFSRALDSSRILLIVRLKAGNIFDLARFSCVGSKQWTRGGVLQNWLSKGSSSCRCAAKVELKVNYRSRGWVVVPLTSSLDA